MINPVVALSAILSLARIGVVTLVAATVAFGLVEPALVAVDRATLADREAERAGTLASADGGRLVQQARFGAVGSAGLAMVSLEMDGLRLGAVPAGGTVGEALAGLGLVVQAGDRLSLPSETALVPGMRIALDRGFPVTLIDGGRATEARSQRMTVGAFLAALSVSLGRADSVAAPLEQALGPGDVVKVVRVADREVTEIASYPFRLRVVDDPTLDYGRSVVDTAGVVGEVSEAYLVRYVDGIESDRTLLSTVVLRSPVTEVRRLGSKFAAPPTPPAEIDRIIRAAAARHEVDVSLLLRVAWCESRFDPNAYNPRAGDSGLFQFIPRTWAANSVRAGYGGASPFDPVASSNVAAWMFQRGQAWQWTCK